MDTVGTFEMAASLAKVSRIIIEYCFKHFLIKLLHFFPQKHGMFTTIHKHYKVEEWVNFSKKVF